MNKNLKQLAKKSEKYSHFQTVTTDNIKLFFQISFQTILTFLGVATKQE